MTGGSLLSGNPGSVLRGNQHYVLEALGYDLFSVQERTSASPQVKVDAEPQITDELVLDLYTTTLKHRSDLKAFLRYRDSAYVLSAGSRVSPNATDSLPSNVRRLRDELIENGGLVEREDCLELTRDIPFSKPSPASALVKGRSSTGYRDWLRVADDVPLGSILSPASSLGLEIDL